MSEKIAHLPVALTPLAYGTDHDEDNDGPAPCQNFDSPREEELDEESDDGLPHSYLLALLKSKVEHSPS